MISRDIRLHISVLLIIIMIGLELYRARIGNSYNYKHKNLIDGSDRVMYRGNVWSYSDILSLNLFIILYSILMSYGLTISLAVSQF